MTLDYTSGLEELRKQVEHQLLATVFPDDYLAPGQEHPASVMAWGPPGIGKSWSVEAATRNVEAVMQEKWPDAKATLVTVSLAHTDLVTLGGLGFVEDGRTRFSRPPILPDNIGEHDLVVLFFDDLGNAPTAVQNFLYNAVWGHQLGTHKLPSNVAIVTASNRPEDKAGVFETSTALTGGRLQNVQVEVPAEETLDYFQDVVRMDATLLAMLRANPGLLRGEPSSAGGWSNPRSIHQYYWRVAQDVKEQGRNGHDVTRAAEFCGEVFAQKLGTFMAYEQEAKLVDRIVEGEMAGDDPAIEALTPDAKFFVAMLTAERMEDLGDLLDFCLEFPIREMATAALRLRVIDPSADSGVSADAIPYADVIFKNFEFMTEE